MCIPGVVTAQQYTEEAKMAAVWAKWPAPVRETFAKLVPNAIRTKLVNKGHAASWGTEVYEIFIKPEAHTIEYLVSFDGRHLATVTHLQLGDVPIAVQSAVRAKSEKEKSEISGTILHWLVGKESYYTFPVRMPVDWKVAPDGKIMGRK